AKISTGEEDTKFGIPREQIATALNLCCDLPSLSLTGISVHIGSQLLDFEPFRQAYRFVADLVVHCRAEGHAIERLDLGGGIGIPYQDQAAPSLKLYADIVRETVGALGCQLAFEPGRYLCADAGILITRVLTVKPTSGKNFLVLDAGMNDLVRPAMYEARHRIISVSEAQKPLENYAVVGPICETSDLFGEDYQLPQPEAGDLLAILDAGAYGSSMAGTYNAKPLIPEVMVQGREYAVVRRRIAVTEQIGWETMPQWLAKRAAA
ncbi:MAG: diaminopimelate decarboxylase, partial [Proteobacteria bacterium]|nr:diaminopimelate decarboxylase [Pseudomonadota bacterium]